ncbi:MAG: hypothetical protein JRF72_04775 [Deltaproteobacteria bacterium]|nr:hypothetical protein [Deltaproteobacteria bacterium]
MDKKRSEVKIIALKTLKWSFLILVILVGSFALVYGVSMHNMQARQISEVLKYLDTGEINEIDRIVRKNMVLTHHFLFYSFMVSVCCLTTIIIFLYISLLMARRKIELYSQALEGEAKHNAAGEPN